MQPTAAAQQDVCFAAYRHVQCCSVECQPDTLTALQWEEKDTRDSVVRAIGGSGCSDLARTLSCDPLPGLALTGGRGGSARDEEKGVRRRRR